MDHLPSGVKVHPIPAFNDNYIWCIHDTQNAYVVDPGDDAAVIAYLTENQLTLAGLLITHHHWDHTDGIVPLLQQFENLTVYGPTGNHIKGITIPVKEGDNITLAALNLTFSVLELPGHTLDHIAYVGNGVVFNGDTLFSAGCGRLFEGTPEQMHRSIQKLMQLPNDTAICCTHEYTKANVDFALAVEPQNTALNQYANWVKQQRTSAQPTLPTTIGEQKQINPFVRVDTQSVKLAAERHANTTLTTNADVFATVRRWKDTF